MRAHVGLHLGDAGCGKRASHLDRPAQRGRIGDALDQSRGVRSPLGSHDKRMSGKADVRQKGLDES